jgi:hypothetical protein
MADNVQITPGSGATVAADDVAGVLHQLVKLAYGTDGVGTMVSGASPLPVQASQSSNVTQVAVAITTSAAVVAANPNRIYVAIQPVGGDVYIGPAGVSTADGIFVPSGNLLVEENLLSAIHAVSATGVSVSVRVREVSR